jgi:hypothetical protein
MRREIWLSAVSYYDHNMAVAVQSRFNADIKEFAPDEEKMFEPVMLTLKEQSGWPGWLTTPKP